MRIRILESLERKARAAIKNLPEFRRLERKRLVVQKRLDAGTISKRLAADLRGILRSRRRHLQNRELYRLLKVAAQKA